MKQCLITFDKTANTFNIFSGAKGQGKPLLSINLNERAKDITIVGLLKDLIEEATNKGYKVNLIDELDVLLGKVPKEKQGSKATYPKEVYFTVDEKTNELTVYNGVPGLEDILARHYYPEEKIDRANTVKALVRRYTKEGYQVSYGTNVHKVFCTNIKEATKEKAEKENVKRAILFFTKSESFPVYLL